MASNDPASKTETESMSFRLEKNNLDQLRDMAKTNRMSLNTLVSQIIDRYLKLWVFDHQFGFFTMSDRLIQKIFVGLSDSEIIKIAEDNGAQVHKEIIRQLYGRVNKKTVVQYMDVFSSRFRAHKHFIHGSRHTITITHNINLVFSKIYYDIMKSILSHANIDTIETERDTSEQGFSISFDF